MSEHLSTQDPKNPVNLNPLPANEANFVPNPSTISSILSILAIRSAPLQRRVLVYTPAWQINVIESNCPRPRQAQHGPAHVPHDRAGAGEEHRGPAAHPGALRALLLQVPPLPSGPVILGRDADGFT